MGGKKADREEKSAQKIFRKGECNVKKLLATWMALLMLVTLLTGCGAAETGETDKAESGTESADTTAQGSETEEDASAGEEVVLEFQQWFDNEMEEGYLQSVCDAFYEETGIRVELLSNPYADTKTQLEASAVAGTMADIVALDGGWIYDYANQGLLANLDELYSTIGFDTSSISTITKVNGVSYAQPLVNFPSLMAVNLDLLEAAGIEKTPETWSEFLAACQAVTDPENNVYGFGMNMSTDNATCMEFFAAFAWNSGGTILDEDGMPYLAGNQILIDTTNFFKSLFDNEVVIPGMYTMTDADKVQEFVNGRIAFMPDSVAHLSNIREQAPDMNMTYINMPHADDYTGDSYIRVNNWACGIAANSEHPEEAAQFLAYLLETDVNADLCVHAGGFPVNTQAEPAYEDTSEAFQAISEIYSQSTGKAEFYSMPTAEALMRVLDEELVMFLDGDYATAEEMLESVQTQFEAAYQ